MLFETVGAKKYINYKFYMATNMYIGWIFKSHFTLIKKFKNKYQIPLYFKLLTNPVSKLEILRSLYRVELKIVSVTKL